MTPEHLEKLNRARREKAARTEADLRRRLRKVWSRLSDDERDTVEYVNIQIDREVAGRRTESTTPIRSVRAEILRRHERNKHA